jgi:hypothetical protein
MKHTITAVLLVGAASVLAHLHAVALTYYPVVHVQSPEGLTFVAVHEPTGERAACGEANDRFLAPFKAMCKECRVVAARCARELQGDELALRDGRPMAHHRVLAPGLSVAIAGPHEVASLGCRDIVSKLAAEGIPSVACLPPTSAGR